MITTLLIAAALLAAGRVPRVPRGPRGAGRRQVKRIRALMRGC